MKKIFAIVTLAAGLFSGTQIGNAESATNGWAGLKETQLVAITNPWKKQNQTAWVMQQCYCDPYSCCCWPLTGSGNDVECWGPGH